MDQHLGIGLPLDFGSEVLWADPGVHVALAHPDVQLASCLPFDMSSQEHVREEQDLLLFGDRTHHLDRVGRGTADV